MADLAVYWSRGAGTAKRRSIRFALTLSVAEGFCFFFYQEKKKKKRCLFSNGCIKNNYSLLFLVLFCFSKKVTKKEPDKGLHPLCRMVPWFGFCTTVACTSVILLLGAVNRTKLKAVFNWRDTHTWFLLKRLRPWYFSILMLLKKQSAT